MKALSQLAAFNQGLRNNFKTTVKDTADGFFEIFHSGFAVIGLTAAILVLVLLGRPDLRYAGETKLLSWLQVRHTVFTTGSTQEEEEVAVADTTKLSKYLETVFNLQAAQILSAEEQLPYDSLLRSTPVFQLEIEDIAKRNLSIKLYVRS